MMGWRPDGGRLWEIMYSKWRGASVIMVGSALPNVEMLLGTDVKLLGMQRIVTGVRSESDENRCSDG